MAARSRTHKPPDEKQLRGQPVVEKVLRAAESALLRADLRAPSVEDIAAASGVNKTTIYRRWGTLGALLLEASTRLFAELAPPVDTGSLETDLVKYFEGVSALVGAARLQQPDRVGLAGPLSGELAALHRELRKRKMAELRVIFKRAVQRGEVADTSMANTFGEVVGGAIVHLEMMEGVRCTPTRIRSIVSLVLRGLPSFSPR